MSEDAAQLETFLNQREKSLLTYVFHGQSRMCLPGLR